MLAVLAFLRMKSIALLMIDGSERFSRLSFVLDGSCKVWEVAILASELRSMRTPRDYGFCLMV